MITLTVALPVYNSRNIVWLAMESLCRQEGITFEWELIICEEADGNAAGQLFYSSYMDRLRLVGCQHIKFIPINTWIPLAQKWRLIGRNCSASSVVFVLQAADCYSFPHRLRRTYKFLGRKQWDWYQCPRGFFYHLFTKQVIEYDHTLYGAGYRRMTALNMALLTVHARKLPLSDKRKGIDGWLLSTIANARMYNDRNVLWKKGIDTQGLNNISKKRARFFQTIAIPFRTTGTKLNQIVPAEIVGLIAETRKKTLGIINQDQPVSPDTVSLKQLVIDCANDVQENTELPIVYVWVKNAQVWNELALSIKSVRKFYSGKHKIFVVGDNPEIKGVIHIPAELIHGFAYCRSFDIANKLGIIINSPLITDNFVLMYDDILFIKPCDYKTLKLKIAHDEVKDAATYFKQGSGPNPSSKWQNLFMQTHHMLSKKGLPTYNYETHLPRLLNKVLLKKVMDRFKITEKACLFNTLYFNSYYEKPDIQLNLNNPIKAGFYRGHDRLANIISECRGKTFMNYDNIGLNELLKKHILTLLKP